MSNGQKNKIVLPTLTACAIWDWEVTGQLSDGTWENSVPHDHWKFWCRCEAVVGEQTGVVMAPDSWRGPTRTKYNVTNLANMKWHEDEMGRFGDGKDPYILRGRMLAYGRMAKALASLGRPLKGSNLREAADYMPAEMYLFRACKASGIWKHEHVAKYMEPVDEALAAAFYEATYTVDELKADLEAISEAMRKPTRREETAAPVAATV